MSFAPLSATITNNRMYRPSPTVKVCLEMITSLIACDQYRPTSESDSRIRAYGKLFGTDSPVIDTVC